MFTLFSFITQIIQHISNSSNRILAALYYSLHWSLLIVSRQDDSSGAGSVHSAVVDHDSQGCITTSTTKKRQQMMSAGDSSERYKGTHLMTWPTLKRFVAYQGGHISDIVKRLPTLAQPADYYPLLSFNVGISDTVKSIQSVSRRTTEPLEHL